MLCHFMQAIGRDLAAKAVLLESLLRLTLSIKMILLVQIMCRGNTVLLSNQQNICNEIHNVMNSNGGRTTLMPGMQQVV